MRRLKKNWKVLAYLTGFVALSLSAAEATVAIYGLPGLVWLVVSLVRSTDGYRSLGSGGGYRAAASAEAGWVSYADSRHSDGFSNPRPLDAAYADYPPFR